MAKTGKKKDSIALEIISAIPLNKNDIEEIVKIIEKKTNKNFIVINQVDKNIIGGLYIRCKDKVIDMSLRNKIESLKERITE